MFVQIMIWILFYIFVPIISIISIIWFVYLLIHKPFKNIPKPTPETKPDFHPVDNPAQFPSEPE